MTPSSESLFSQLSSSQPSSSQSSSSQLPSSQSSSACVAVALSGGVDSLYTLIALHDKGVPVMGVHGLFSQHLAFKKNTDGPSTLVRNDLEAQHTVHALHTICNRLGIPFHTLDCGAHFYETVILPFVTAYASGQTPNPCALCNAQIKFGFLLKTVQELGGTHLATGHYARLLVNQSLVKEVEENETRETRKSGVYSALQPFLYDAHDPVITELAKEDVLYFTDENNTKSSGISRARLGHPLLLQGADIHKDQSYFLSLVPAKHLSSVLFPLGSRHKKDIVSFLNERHIAPPQQKESQEVCFIPNDAYREYLPDAASYFGITLGAPGVMVVLDENKQVGTHKGLWQYTEGQRKGLGVGWKEPLYVVNKNRASNILYLGAKNTLFVEKCLCHSVNIFIPKEYWPKEVFIKTRYREAFKKGHAEVIQNSSETLLQLSFTNPVELIAAGQIGAVYAKVHAVNEADGRPVFCLLAGGIIAE